MAFPTWPQGPRQSGPSKAGGCRFVISDGAVMAFPILGTRRPGHPGRVKEDDNASSEEQILLVSKAVAWVNSCLVGVGAGGVQVGRRGGDELGAGVRKQLLVGGIHSPHHLHHLLIVPEPTI